MMQDISRSCNPPQESLEKMGVPSQVIGDTQKMGLAFDAVHSGFAAGGGLSRSNFNLCSNNLHRTWRASIDQQRN